MACKKHRPGLFKLGREFAIEVEHAKKDLVEYRPARSPSRCMRYAIDQLTGERRRDIIEMFRRAGDR